MGKSFTAQARRQVKRACKGRVLHSLGRCIGVQLLYMLPFVLLVLLMYAVLFGRAIALVLSGTTDEYRLTMALMQGMNMMWVIVLVMLAVSGPLTFGLMRFYIALQRGGEPHVGTLLEPFTSLRMAWTGIKMVFCLAFRAFLWTVGPAVVYTVLSVAVTVGASVAGSPAAVDVPLTILYVLFLLALIPVQVKVMTYQAGWALLRDDETRGVWDATRAASAAFRGQFGRLFVFVLSFLGWLLLTAGVAYLCIGLGLAGLFVVQGGTGVAIFALCCVAALCLLVLLGGFVNAYQMTSFFGMYEYLSAQAPGDASPGQNGGNVL